MVLPDVLPDRRSAGVVAHEAPTADSAGVRALVGAGTQVPVVTGGSRRYVNLDYAASAPCLQSVKDAVDRLLPWYSSVHRGAGFTSQVCTSAYEGARTAVRSFLGARPDDAVIFTRNTTDAINLLADALPRDVEILVFGAEHHANLLPWRRRDVRTLPIPTSAPQALEILRDALAGTGRHRPRLLAITGASNVTGEIWPAAQMADLVHRHGGRVFLDAAQLAPHRSIDMAGAGFDYLALSGHKLYAPFGSGALVGRPDWLADGAPYLFGGGAVRFVGLDDVVWADLPDRQEAGSPNVVGAVALGVACRTLQAIDLDRQAEIEGDLLADARGRLAGIPGVQVFELWPAAHPRIGVLPFTVRSVGYATLAAALSAEYGIGVRHGCFCAHPLMAALLGIGAGEFAGIGQNLRAGTPTTLPGMARASIGLGTTSGDLDRLVRAVTEIALRGPRWTYLESPDHTEARPVPDTRCRPELPFDLA